MKKKQKIKEITNKKVIAAPYANARFKPENFKETTAEYIYYKAFISGLEKAKGLTDSEIQTLIDVYSVKTISIDKMLEDKE